MFYKKNSKIKIEVHPNDILETTMNFKQLGNRTSESKGLGTMKLKT